MARRPIVANTARFGWLAKTFKTMNSGRTLCIRLTMPGAGCSTVDVDSGVAIVAIAASAHIAAWRNTGVLLLIGIPIAIPIAIFIPILGIYSAGFINKAIAVVVDAITDFGCSWVDIGTTIIAIARLICIARRL